MPLIQLKNISKIYKMGKTNVFALNNISLVVEEGEFLSITGPSGSGKTTLMNIIGLLDRPTKGYYYLKGKRVDQISSKEQARIRNREIGFVFQNFNLLPRASVLDNIMLPLVYGQVSFKRRKEKVLSVIKEVDLTKRLSHSPAELSGGEQQRVAIARALVNDPSIILADEPTGNLDSKHGKEILDILERLNRKGKTVIIVTHEKTVAQRAKREIRLLDGKIV